MLFLLVMLTSGQILVRTRASELSNAMLKNVSNERPQDLPSPSEINYQKSPSVTSTGNKTLAANKARVESNMGDFLYHSSTIDLVLKNDSSRKYGSMKSQLDRHSYKINPSELRNVPSARANSTSPQPDAKGGLDELKSSESSMNYLVSSRSEEGESDHSSPNQEENNQASVDDDRVFSEKSSSAMSEQKVVKELTKILSKGMSGATDQIKLDTLENWKRRQKENKIAKDKRAKLFEDLLTAAIESHPERSKVKTGKRRNKKKGPKFGEEVSKSLTGLINDPSVDEDLATDAEGVVQSLQNLVGASQLTGQDDAYFSGVEDASLSNNEESESNENGHDNEEKESKKSASSSNERPIVKQFKKIKQRISQRRKQLDHIKKMFNVELALNPNDGSLMGKSVAKSKTKKEPSSQSEEADESDLEIGGSASGKKTTKSAKMTELLNYLKENPEILASVMDELSEDAAYPKASLAGNSDILNPFVSPSISDQSEPSLIGSSSRRKISSARQQEPETISWSRSRGSTASKKLADMSLDLPDNLEFLSTRRQRSRNSVDASMNGLYQTLSDQAPAQSTFSKVKSAEALLLESLRERQLMNLARLERVLAERQQASSNRSSVYSALNTQQSLSYAKQGDQMMTENDRNDQRSEFANRKTYQDEQKGSRPSNEEVVHHFLVMNNSMPSSNGSQITEDFISNQQPYQKSVYKLPKQNELWVTRGQQRYPLQSNNNENRYNLINQQQLHSDSGTSLNRFKGWRDASQSEASSSNARTRLPYNASLFTAGDLTSDSSSSLVGQNGIYNDRYSKQAISRSDDQREIDTRSVSPNSGFRDYADSIVTRPGPFLVPMPQPGYQQSATSSVFMTRSSVGQGEQYPTVKPAYARDFNRKEDSSRSKSLAVDTIDDSDKQSIKDDERFERERPVMQEQNLRYPTAPVDYFSAYKQELPKDEKQLERRPRRVHVQRPEPTERPETTDESNEEELGAIWAK